MAFSPEQVEEFIAAIQADARLRDRVREAILADAGTSRYADRIGIDVDGDHVVLVGRVDDLDDEDLLLSVASTATGVDEVTSALDVETL